MFNYFLRRLLLIPPTLFLITLLVFGISRMMPGGPVDRQLNAAVMAANEQNSTANDQSSSPLGEEQIEAIEEEYGYDKPVIIAYFQWLGLLPKNSFLSKAEYKEGEGVLTEVELILKGVGRRVIVEVKDSKVESAKYEDGSQISEDNWSVRIENEALRQKKYRKRNGLEAEEDVPKYDSRVVVFKNKFQGLLQGNLGRSIIYGDTVLSMILDRVPVASYFGILTALITYLVSIPLGVLKAIKHRTPIDTLSSILIFIGYSVPGFALGAVLVIWLGAQMELFPLFGLVSSDFGSMSMFDKIKDLAHHTLLPLLCYVIGGFAYLTMMMKNNLMDNLAADYVKTAISRGSSFPHAVFGHALKNSLIPIATSLGGLITLFVSGSLLIERVFDIQGFGLLQFNAVIFVDIPLVMGTLTISSLLVLVGNILSDFIVAAIDPRIKFN